MLADLQVINVHLLRLLQAYFKSAANVFNFVYQRFLEKSKIDQ